MTPHAATPDCMNQPRDTGSAPSKPHSRISLVRCPDYDLARVRQALRELLEPFGGMKAFVSAGARVVLKPNYVVARPADRCANTHPVVILAVAELVRECGGEPIVADSPGWGSAENVAEVSGFAPLARQAGIPIVSLKDPVRPSTPHTVRFLRTSATIQQADVVINLPKFKAHQQMLLSLAVKNVFGCVPGRRKAALHMLSRDDRHWFARMLVENYQAVQPQLTIMDAIVAMEGNGPSNGTPRPLGFLMAGTDCVAMDRVAVEILGIPWRELTTLAAAAEMGVGCTRLDEIDIVGPPPHELRLAEFHLPLLMPISFSPWRIARGLIRNYIILWKEQKARKRA